MNTCCNNIYPDEDLRRWENCNSTALANPENYYTKSEVDEIIEDISISGGGITSGEAQSMIDASVEPIEGSVEALSGAVEQLSTDLENKADRSEIPSLENYYNKTEVNAIADTKLDASAYTPTDLSNYYTKQEIENKHYLTEHQPLKTINGQVISGTGNITISGSADLSNYYTKSQIDSKLDEKEDNLVVYEESNNGHPYDWYGKIAVEYNSIEVNGRGITISTDENSSLALEAPTATLNQSPIINEDNLYGILGDYQEKLEAGTGIAINGNVISATGGGSVTVDQSLDSGSTNPVTNSAITQAINAKADASNVYTKTEVNNIVNNKFWCGTQAQYEALATKDPNVLYLIHE